MASDDDTLSARDGAPPVAVPDDALEDSIVTIDPRGVITSCNVAAERLLGCRAEDAVGRSLLTFHDPVEIVARATALGVGPGIEVLTAQTWPDPAMGRVWTCVGAGGERVSVTRTLTALRGAGGDAGFAWVARPRPEDRAGAFARAHTSEGLLAVLDAAPIATGIARAADGVILFANRACLDLLGWDAEEIAGRTLADIGFWTDPARRATMLERVVRDGFVHNIEEEVATRDGATRIVLASITIVDFDGEPSLVGHINDITESRRLQAKLRDSEERFLQITETFEQGFMLSNIDPPRVVYASPALARIFGVDLDALLRDPLVIQAVIHPDDRPRVVAQREAITGRTDLEFRIVRPDGELRWIRTRVEPVRTDDGEVHRLASVSEDVTEERALREALRESEENFRLLAENSTDVIGRLSGDQRIQYVSPACRSVYGYEPEAMVGRFGYEFIHPDDLEAIRADFSGDVELAEVITNTYRVRRGDGRYVWVEAKIRPLRDPETGEVVEFHTVARDVGERKQAEADVQRAMEEAELANAAKSEFLSRMSHELRTPLHAILGFGDLLERGSLRPQQHEQLQQITKSGRHLLELINEVLDLTRIEEGELHVSLEPVEVDQLVSETFAMLAPLATARCVTLAPHESDGRDLHVLADRQRLKQVLLNLLSNAVKYNREGGGVRVVTAGREGSFARIEVVDTGLGIAADDIARAFAAFERLGAEATEVEGTGLGLALTKRLVETMGGSIGVESEIGRGTTFWLELPAVPAPSVQRAAPRRSTTAPAAPVRTDPRTVLYIEDNPSNIKLVETILRERPAVTLIVAQQGSLGLELAREHVPALVLLDLNLPDISGMEVLRRLRAHPRTADLPVVMVSADATSAQVKRLRDAGAQAYLTKPFELEQFLAVIDGLPAPGETADAEPALEAIDAEQPVDGPLDVSFLEKLRYLHPDGQAVAELIEIYLEDSPVRLRALVRAASEGDPDAVRAAAHAWRGSCSLTGAHRLVGLLADIETLARVGSVPDAEQLAQVQRAYDEACLALIKQFR